MDSELTIALKVCGVEVLSAPCNFSMCGEASFRIIGGVAISPTDTVITAALLTELGAVAASMEINTSECSEDDWAALPGSRPGRRSLSIDIPGFTWCIDTCACFDGASSMGRAELRAVRVLRHRQSVAAPTQDERPVAEAAVVVMPAGCVDADDESAIPTIGAAVHGEWLRHSARPGPPARAWPALLDAEALGALRGDALALVRTHGCGGKTFWVGAGALPRCQLEAFALHVLHLHGHTSSMAEGPVVDADKEGGAPDPTLVGAEWWVQLRSVAPARLQGVEGAAGDDAGPMAGEGEADGSSIAFHYDCDEGLYSATGELVPPWLSTVTYLSALGAPTLILPSMPDYAGGGCPTDGVGAYVSFPHPGKHLCFDGRLLHGCPHTLAGEFAGARHAPTDADASATGATDEGKSGDGLRLTLLVNLWRCHRPVGPQPLPSRVAAALGAERALAPLASPLASLLASLPRVSADGETVAVRDDAAPEREFAPSAKRKALSPAAQTVRLRGLPCMRVLREPCTVAAVRGGLLHAPSAQVVLPTL